MPNPNIFQPDELAPQADSPPNTPPGGVRGLVGSEMGQESSRGHHSENHVRVSEPWVNNRVAKLPPQPPFLTPFLVLECI